MAWPVSRVSSPQLVVHHDDGTGDHDATDNVAVPVPGLPESEASMLQGDLGIADRPASK
jgi:hypothetical protein